ncbi:gamma-glutamyl-gamma-aminobutyrate hydrolase family protein [Pleomorphovibrio marinus]|uniref:gamma-glutamyl-gamma-aminobutyrate hydrolase family protein n=1 Tax=Pleomorphovibrio marinus TaxID=2164132 RepID=UPI000E0B216D|nr:gamma-glutamyl-gamma-aminobutyrate hydrolase family protein [Pleomorphovibrio marinus]
MLKIGVSACFMYPDKERLVFGPKTLTYIENDMAGYISQEGVLPLLLPNLGLDKIKPIIDQMDGFVFQGGTDLAPKFYGEKPIIPGKWLGDSYRDEYELRLMELAFQSGKPILAICRGIQVLNVFCGGTLYQDIATQVPEAIIHRDAERYDTLHHGVHLANGKILDQTYAEETLKRVNSVHHQAIKDLGSDLEVLATCKEDGLIEAVGYTRAAPGKILGVQWHPEFTYHKPGEALDPKALYGLFLSHVKKQTLCN